MAHRSLVRACLVAATLAWSAVTANAATFTYDLTLTQSFGTPGLFGTGQFVVTGATNSGLFTAPGDLNSLEFNIDGHVFTLGQATGGSGQVVLDGIGHLTNIDYSAPAPISLWVVVQASGIVYNYKDVATNHFSYGLITAVLHEGDAEQGLASTPLPGALPLFATGLGALGLLGWRRKRKAAALAA